LSYYTGGEKQYAGGSISEFSEGELYPDGLVVPARFCRMQPMDTTKNPIMQRDWCRQAHKKLSLSPIVIHRKVNPNHHKNRTTVTGHFSVSQFALHSWTGFVCPLVSCYALLPQRILESLRSRPEGKEDWIRATEEWLEVRSKIFPYPSSSTAYLAQPAESTENITQLPCSTEDVAPSPVWSRAPLCLPAPPWTSLRQASVWTSLHFPAQLRMSLCLPAQPRMSLCLPAQPRMSLCLPAQLRMLFHLPAWQRMLLHLPAWQGTSLYHPALLRTSWPV
ncbi:hypothetical protein AMELA_G00100900, partial [Ameiurus melas]